MARSRVAHSIMVSVQGGVWRRRHPRRIKGVERPSVEAARSHARLVCRNGVPVYSPAYASTKLYCLVKDANVYEQLAQGCTRHCNVWKWTCHLQLQVQRYHHYATQPLTTIDFPQNEAQLRRNLWFNSISHSDFLCGKFVTPSKCNILITSKTMGKTVFYQLISWNKVAA